MSDKSILDHISKLVAEEHRLGNEPDPTGTGAAQLRRIAAQLDQYWDLLRQRRAKREFGDDVSTARMRDVDIVERYEN